MHRVTNHCDAQTGFFEWTSLQPFHGCDVVTCFDVVGCRVRWSNVDGCELWGDVKWGNVVSCEMSCHVMWSDVISFDVMRFLVLCDVTWCTAMSCDVLSCDELSSVVKWCGAMGWDLMSSWCRVAGCDVTLCGSKGLSGVNWKMIWWSVLHRSTPYYTVLQSITPVLQLYYTLLLQYYSVLQSTTPVLLQYYSVLQSTTPILLCTTKNWNCKHHLLKCQTIFFEFKPKENQIISQSILCHAYPSIRRRILYWKLQHFALRLSTQISPNTAPATKSNTPRSLNAAPATKNDAHHWLSSHMQRHLQCAEQQASPSNLTKYCACHAKWLSWLIFVTYGTSFTMRGATGIALQPHQILRLPRKMTLMIDLRHIWNVIYNARSNRHHPPTSPNIAPATQKCTPKSKRNSPRTVEASIPMRGRFDHDPNMMRTWSEHELVISHPPVRRGYFSRFGDAFCIENYNISRSGYLPRFHRILRLPQKVTLQDHQMLRLPRKMMRIIDCRRICNVIYNARSNRHRPPTSPNTAPATQNDSHDWSSSHMERHLQCAEQQASPSNLTKYCACHAKWLSWLIFVTYGTSFTMRGATGITLQPHQILRLPRKSALQNLSEILRERLKRQFQCAADSTMIRAWSEHDPNMNSSSRTRPFAEVTFRASETHFVLKITTSRAPAIYPDFTEYCACHKKWHSKITKCCACHEKCHSKITKYCMPRKVTLQDHQILRLPPKVTLQDHQILRLPRKVTLNCYFTELILYWTVITELLLYWTVTTELLLYWAVTLLNCYFTELLLYGTVTLLSWYFTELLLYWTVTLLSCYFTELLLSWTELLLWGAVTLLSCYFTELLLYWTVTLLSCYFTELLLYWAVTLLSCYFTELLLYWTVTLLNCYFTELLLYWTVTLLSCYFTELWLYWTVTLLNCYFTELLLYWTVTLLNCYFTGLFAFLNLRNSEVSHLNFLWS